MGRLVVLVPCSGEKAPIAEIAGQLPAGELYVGSFHRFAVDHARRLGADVVIVSALHGLVSPDHLLRDYDMTIEEAERAETGLPRFITRTRHQAEALGLSGDVRTISFLPKRYAHHVRTAGVRFEDLLAGSRGIGQQRGRIAALTTPSEQLSLFPERTTT